MGESSPSQIRIPKDRIFELCVFGFYISHIAAYEFGSTKGTFGKVSIAKRHIYESRIVEIGAPKLGVGKLVVIQVAIGEVCAFTAVAIEPQLVFCNHGCHFSF